MSLYDDDKIKNEYIQHRYYGNKIDQILINEMAAAFKSKFHSGEYHRHYRVDDHNAAVRIWVDVVEEFRMRELYNRFIDTNKNTDDSN